jgi:23S rRNA (cytosine1962-C5)-methyltransferase
MDMPVVRLKHGEDKRLRSGHLWVFSNEIDSVEGTVEAGDAVRVLDSRGRLIGTGLANPHSLIAARLVSRGPVVVDEALITRRIETAIAYRERIMPGQTALRIVSSDADLVPGLIIDRYGDTFVVQSLTAGIERRLDMVVSALVRISDPAAVVLRNDSPMRRYEGLEIEKRVVHGTLDGPVEIEADGLTFLVDVLEGQKTGFFLDQRENRKATAALAEGRDVLDCCSYTGAWSVSFGAAGAASLTLVDSSESALDGARANVAANALACPVTYNRADMFSALAGYRRERARFGVVTLDPPALAKSRKRIREALKAYRALNRLALTILEQGGYLVTCTCSHLVDREAFEHALVGAAAEAHRPARIVEVRGQSADHPVILGLPETRYLTCVVLEVL